MPNAPAQDYSYEVKETCEQCVDYFPMPKGDLRDQVEALALGAYRVLECRDTGRSTSVWTPRAVRRSSRSIRCRACIRRIRIFP